MYIKERNIGNEITLIPNFKMEGKLIFALFLCFALVEYGLGRAVVDDENEMAKRGNYVK